MKKFLVIWNFLLVGWWFGLVLNCFYLKKNFFFELIIDFLSIKYFFYTSSHDFYIICRLHVCIKELNFTCLIILTSTFYYLKKGFKVLGMVPNRLRKSGLTIIPPTLLSSGITEALISFGDGIIKEIDHIIYNLDIT